MNIAKTIYAAMDGHIDVQYTRDIVFAKRATGDLTLQLLSPYSVKLPENPNRPLNIVEKRFKEYHKGDEAQSKKEADERKYPAIVLVPGSGWAGAEGHNALGKAYEIARRGFIVASISYRGTFKDDVRYPAAVQDTKEAIRFLRANAELYKIDENRIGLLGGSSGGHTAAAAALTGRQERFNIGENLEYSSDVDALCLFYAPNDLEQLVSDRIQEKKRLRPGEGEYPFEAWEIFQEDFLQAKDPMAVLRDASPINYIKDCEKLPPVLFLNGDDDQIIPVQQGLRFCEKIRQAGGRAEFVKIAGAGHGGSCWVPEAIDEVVKFFKTYLAKTN